MTESGEPAPVTPNLYALSGAGIAVMISTTGIDGRASVTYQDAALSETFYGDDVTFEPTALDIVVTVVLARSVDLGVTTFAVSLPRLTIAPSTSHHFDTIGITTTRSTPLGGVAPANDQTSSTQTALAGTASLVQF